MDYQQIISFIAVAECQSFTKAASRLYVTQPGLSRQISLLETELGHKLFERDKRLVTLTEAGEIFLQEAYPMLFHRRRLQEALSKINETPTAEITLGHIGWLELTYMPEFLRMFIKKYNNTIDVNLQENQSLIENLDLLRVQKIDSMVTILSGHENLAGLCCEEIMPVNTYFVVRKDHPLAQQREVCYEDIKDEYFVSLTRDNRPFVVDAFYSYFTQNGMVTHITKFASNKTDYFILIESGQGAGLVNDITKRPSFPSHELTFIPVTDYMQFQYCFLWNEKSITPEIEILKNELKTFVMDFYK